MRILEKKLKITSASGDPLPNPRLPPAAGGSVNKPPRYYSSVLLQTLTQFVFSAKCVLLFSKQKNIYCKCSAFVFSHFCTYFLLKTL